MQRLSNALERKKKHHVLQLRSRCNGAHTLNSGSPYLGIPPLSPNPCDRPYVALATQCVASATCPSRSDCRDKTNVRLATLQLWRLRHANVLFFFARWTVISGHCAQRLARRQSRWPLTARNLHSQFLRSALKLVWLLWLMLPLIALMHCKCMHWIFVERLICMKIPYVHTNCSYFIRSRTHSRIDS